MLNLSTDVIYDFLANAFSEDIAAMLLNVPESASGIGLVITMIVGYYTASNGPASIIITSNAIYGEKQTGFFKRRLKSIIMTIFLVLLFIFMLIVPVFGDDKIIELFEYVDLNSSITDKVTTIIRLLQGPVTWLIMYFFIKILYTIAPNKRIKSKNVGYGAIFTSVSWIIITYGYSFYINNIAYYSTFYGSLANIVMLMIWIYILAYVFTIGMALNYRKEEVELEKTGSINIEKK